MYHARIIEILINLVFQVSPMRAARRSLDLSKAAKGWGNPQADPSVERTALTLRGQTFPHGYGRY